MALTIMDRTAEDRVLRYIKAHDGRRMAPDVIEAVCLTDVPRNVAERALWHLLDLRVIRFDREFKLVVAPQGLPSGPQPPMPSQP